MMQKILITRPQLQSTALAYKLQQAHFFPIICPTLEIIAIQKDDLIRQLKNLNNIAMMLFTSANAVLHAVDELKRYWPILPANLRIAAIGNSTAKALLDQKLPVHLKPENDFSSEGLLALAELQQLSNKKIFIISGVGGRNLLPEILTQRGAEVIKIPVYQRIRPVFGVEQENILNTLAFDVIVSTSVESLQNLMSYIKPEIKTDFLRKNLIVLSERMRLVANNLGFQRVTVTQNVSDNAIIAAIKTINSLLPLAGEGAKGG